MIPKSRFDPVAVKFLSLNPYNLPNLAADLYDHRPDQRLHFGKHYLSDRQGYLGKIDQSINDKQKLFVRYIWNKYRVIGSRNNILFNWSGDRQYGARLRIAGAHR